MAAISQSEQSLWDRFKGGVVSLRPLQGFFSWVFRALAICATFAIVVCSIIIGMEIAAHDAFVQNPLLANLATATQDVLNAAIEGAMLGCIALAKQAKESGDTPQKHRMLTMGVIFLILTITTIGVQVFKPAGWDNPLLFVRCGAGLIYAAISHFWGSDEENAVPQHIHDRLEILLQDTQNNFKLELNNRLQAIENRFKPENIETVLSSKIEALQATLSQDITQKKEDENEALIRQFEEIKASLIESVLSLKNETNNEPKISEITPPNLAQNNDQNTPQISELIMSGISWIKTHQNTPPNLAENSAEKTSINSAVIISANTPTNPASNLPKISEGITPDNSADNLDEETIFDEVIMRFPNIASWRATGQRSVSVEEIIDATNLPKITVSKQAKKPTNKGGFIGTKIKNKYRIMSVISWLKTVEITPIITPTNSAKNNPPNNEGNLTENTPLICEEITPIISPKITIKLPTLIDEDFGEEIDRNSESEKGANTDELEMVIIPESQPEEEENYLQTESEISPDEVLETPILESNTISIEEV